MFHDILVPVDLSDRNQRALELALELASRAAGRVRLLHVVETLGRIPFDELKDFYAKLERESAQRLAEFALPFERAGVDVRVEVAFGNRSQQITRCAHDGSCDLVVMSPRRLEPGERHPWSSISHRVGVLAGCSVLLVR